MATTLDFVILIAYILLILYIGIRASRREHLEGYLANNRRTKLLLLAGSNIASAIGAGAIVGVASAAYVTGISYGLIVLISNIVGSCFFIWVAPKIKAFGDKHRAHTTGDMMAYRFGRWSRHAFAVAYVVAAFIWSAVQFVAIAQLLRVLIGVRFEFALLIAVGVTIFYTSLGGLISDIWTDFIQFWLMLLTFIILVPIAWAKAGGISALAALPAASFDPLAFGGWAFLIGGIFLSGLVIVPEVYLWQRIYSADSMKTARRTYVWSIPGYIIFIGSATLIGLFATQLVPGVEPDTAFFTLMNLLLPTGFLGLAYAGMLAVVMSTIDSILLAGASTILKDLYMPFFHPKMHEHELLNMARYITALFGIIGALVAYIFQDIVQLTLLSAFTIGCLSFAVIAGLFWKRATSKGAIASIICGLATTYLLFPSMPKIAGIPGFFVGVVVLIVVSLLTKHAKEENPVVV
jgi:SSS family solute:Na+ symporter